MIMLGALGIAMVYLFLPKGKWAGTDPRPNVFPWGWVHAP